MAECVKVKSRNRKKPKNKNMNPNAEKNSRDKFGKILGEDEKLTFTEFKKLQIKNGRNEERDLIEKITKPKPILMTVPEFRIPTELYKLLKRNLQAYPGISKRGEVWVNFLKLLPEIKDIQEKHYLLMLKRLLYLEDYYNELAMEQFNFKKQRISRSKYVSNQFVIIVPGLAEDRPSIMRGDVVEVKEIRDPVKHKLKVTYVGLTYVTVRGTPAFKNIYQSSNLYDVKFYYSNWPIRVCHFAISLINRKEFTLLLHPVSGKVTNQPENVLTLFDTNIRNNPEQMQAVQRILGRTSYPAPYVVFGPPGTGKTATIVEAISQIWQKDKLTNKILVCTPSNAAANEITKRLLKNVPEQLIYRMLSSSIGPSDVNESIHGCSHFVRGKVDLIPMEVLMSKKIIITTLVTCVRLVRMNLCKNQFTYIFIDEAGQATQPETLIPYRLLCPINENSHAQLVLSGDPKQLGPVIMTKLGQHLLGKSMLDRLMDCFPLYQKGAEDKFDPNFITKLLKNFRSHEAILRLPNKMFYQNELVACGGQEIFRGVKWSKLPNKNFPLIFHAVDGFEKREKYSPSVCNEIEAKIVMDYVIKLLGRKLGKSTIEEKDIGIVTPFRLQKSVILNAFEKKKLYKISVGTVETFQGQEKDIIIVSTVRSVLFKHDGRFHIGFLFDDKRFNVTITRAKSLLIVVGNPKVLQIDNCWRQFIKYCQENEACLGDKFTLSEMSEDEKKQLLNNRLPTPKKNKDRKLKPLRPKMKTQKSETKEKLISLISAKKNSLVYLTVIHLDTKIR